MLLILLGHCMPKRSQVDFIFRAFSCGKSPFSAKGLVQDGLFQLSQRREFLLVVFFEVLGLGGKGDEVSFNEGEGVFGCSGRCWFGRCWFGRWLAPQTPCRGRCLAGYGYLRRHPNQPLVSRYRSLNSGL
jgi:hypothetical protein